VKYVTSTFSDEEQTMQETSMNLVASKRLHTSQKTHLFITTTENYKSNKNDFGIVAEWHFFATSYVSGTCVMLQVAQYNSRKQQQVFNILMISRTFHVNELSTNTSYNTRD
jgi:hypothetical protein